MVCRIDNRLGIADVRPHYGVGVYWVICDTSRHQTFHANDDEGALAVWQDGKSWERDRRDSGHWGCPYFLDA